MFSMFSSVMGMKLILNIFPVFFMDQLYSTREGVHCNWQQC